ncbi:MAG TPA: PQQ-binding-like beta-propeller repeat protein [Streptosporangiaceae bacterium]|nr:PQQ-binding-like beta-propeller repeat protein [Streptosporangiaceae bacterium]
MSARVNRGTGRLRSAARFRVAAAAVAAALACAIPASAAFATGQAQRRQAANQTAAARRVPVQDSQCCAPTAADVPKLGGDYGDQDYSSLSTITPLNVRGLAGAWRASLDDTAVRSAQESTPVAVSGDLYVQTGQGDVFAVNGASGRVIWKYTSGLTGTERGVAVGNGLVFSALGGEHVVALSQQTGSPRWQVQVGTPGQDTTANGSATPWTLYYKGLVLVGTENGGGSGMRGHIYALRASNGSVAWSFAATAGPGQAGHGSWAGDSWLLGGGDVWMPPAIDPRLGLIYLTLANPEPRTDGAARAGNNLYTNSLVALRWNTGKLVWHFQSVHHDLWDYDNEMAPVIASVRYRSGVRKVVIYGSKTAWLYYLDAQTGKPVVPVHEKKVPVLPALASSPTQPVPDGDSLVPTCPGKTGIDRPVPGYASGCEFAPFGNKPVVVSPGRGGGGNWAPLSFDQKTGLVYDPASEENAAFSSGLPYGQPTFWSPAGELRGGVLDAIDPRTNTIVWQRATRYSQANGDGILTTASGLLFEGSPDGLLYARSAASGKVLWKWQTGTGIATTPITYFAHGRQYVAVFACGGSVPCNLWAFRLHGTVPPVKAPARQPVRVLVSGPTVAGSAIADTVVMGRTWDTSTHSPGRTENLGSQTAMAPPVMTVPAGTKVIFVNPAGNAKDHCARSFFDPASFTIGPLAPGGSGSFHFVNPGTYFYNDCAGFPWNTGEIVVR